MTVEVTTDFSGPYITNGATTVFPFTFIAMSIVEVAVLLRDADGVDSIASPGLYTVFRSDDGTGSVVFSVAPASGYDLYVFSDVSFSQSVAFEDGSGWKAAPVNSVADRSAARDIWLKGKVDRALVVPLGETPAELPSVDNRVGKFLAWDAEGNPVAADGTGPDGGLRADLAASGGSALTGFIQSGTGAVARSIQAKMRENRSAKDFNAVGDGVADDSAELLAAAVAARTAFTDGLRVFAGDVQLGVGKFKMSAILELAAAGGITGFTVYGAGAGSTEIIYDGPTATIKCTSSSMITWRDVSFVSSGVDDNQVAFTINQTGNPLRSWRFERCNFNAFYKCFAVTGTSMCSEFYFKDCKFQQCYWLMENDNDQAVNWNFVNCDWENAELTTSKNKNLAAAFNLKKGTFVKWTGGSMIFHGMLVYYNLTASGVFSRTSHKMSFNGVRIELVDDGSGGHASLIDRVTSGYVNGSNSPTTTISGGSILFRGSIPTTITIAKVWANCSLRIEDVESEGGKVVGILDATTAASNASVIINDAVAIKYEEDTAARVNTHDQHNVTIIPDNSTAGTQLLLDQRLCSLTVPSTGYLKCWWVRGATGSLPVAGTTTIIEPLPDHFVFLKLFVQRFQAGTQDLTVLIRNQADTTTYATLTILAAELYKGVEIGLEVGFQIPSGTPLMLKYTGTADPNIKGVVGFHYL